jgi:type IV secretory pathway protease TraF
MAAQHGHLLATAPLLKTVAAMVPQHMCIQESQMGAHQ